MNFEGNFEGGTDESVNASNRDVLRFDRIAVDSSRDKLIPFEVAYEETIYREATALLSLLGCGNGSGPWQMFSTRPPPLSLVFRSVGRTERPVFNHTGGATFAPPAETSVRIFDDPGQRSRTKGSRSRSLMPRFAEDDFT